MIHFFWDFVAFIVTVGLLVTVHEFGHFLAACYYGVTVERFSIGFGYVLWRWYDKSNTEYVISAIPLGGYIKMLDERTDNVISEHRHKAFNNKKIWQRIVITFAGSLFNFLLAIFAYWLVFLLGVPNYKPIIGEIITDSIADKAKIFPNMQIRSIDGYKISDWDSAHLKLLDKIGSETITLGVTQLNSNQEEKKILNLHNWQFEINKQDIMSSLGIIPLISHIEPVITEVQQGSAAKKAGLQIGDKIIKVNGHLFSTWKSFVKKIKNNPGQNLYLNIERKGSILSIVLIPDKKEINEHIEGIAGIFAKITSPSEKYKTLKKYNLFTALIQSINKTCSLIQFTFNMLTKLINGNIKLNNLSGPVVIAQNARISAEHGIIYYLMFLALISINLGIINLLPLPVLDGGHLLFLMIEKIKGRPVSEQIQNFSYSICSALLILLMGIALFNDIFKLK